MKGKALVALMAATVIVISVPVSATAAYREMIDAENGLECHGQCRERDLNFKDENNDGICDNFVDKNADGICNGCTGLGNQGGNRGNVLNFKDENNDGICDTFASGRRRVRGRNRK